MTQGVDIIVFRISMYDFTRFTASWGFVFSRNPTSHRSHQQCLLGINNARAAPKLLLLSSGFRCRNEIVTSPCIGGFSHA
jgi:hypothetical protein